MSELLQIPVSESLFYSPQAYKQTLVDQIHDSKHHIDDDQIRKQVRMMKQQTADAEEGYIDRLKSLFTIKFYQEYFDITTEIVVKRILNGFNPFSGSFFAIGAGKPDLYGPFWILTTLILEMAAISNLTSYVQDPSHYQGRIAMIPMAAAIIYGKGICFPLLVRVLLKCFKCEHLTYAHLVCLYGYASGVTCFATFFQLIDIPSVQWGLFLYVMFNTTLFIVTNLNNELKLMEKDQQRFTLIGIVAGMQIALAVFYKFYFFGDDASQASSEQNKLPKHIMSTPH